MCIWKKSHKRDIIFLGAGAMNEAGMPLMSPLIESMNEHFNDNPEFQSVRKDIDEMHRVLAKLVRLNERGVDASTRNIEYIFSLFDLLIQSKDIHDCTFVEDYEKNMIKFKRYLSKYFYEITVQNNTLDITYIRQILDTSDTIITINWDLVIERELTSLYNYDLNLSDLWGYKVDDEDYIVKQLVEKNIRKVINKEKSKQKYRYYKLHGSVGWHYGDSSIILSREVRKEFGAGGPPDPDNKDIPLITPSFIKQINSNIMQEIWLKATNEIQKAKSIDIVGYSLPKADQAIRALLIHCRNDIDVRIITKAEKEDEERAKWEQFLDKKLDDTKFFNIGAKKFYQAKG